ncbi:recombinase family protein [Planctomycetota bacterium]
MNENGTSGALACWQGGGKKINERHHDRMAVVYVRQSSVRQVNCHRESTELQYSLQGLAKQLGWPDDRVVVIDDDLGLSGATAAGRAGFQRLLSEVALDHVGVILGVDMSRLARSCRDWYQLLELCALFGTLIGDLDGLYDPAQYNDRLLLGLKGTMSEAELHVLKQRMLQGKLQKARRGELRGSVPMGYQRSAAGEVIFDPNEEVQAAVRLVFQQFELLGTVGAVLRYMVEHDVQLGVRARHGTGKGDLEWRRPCRATLTDMIRNPFYAGAYAYGRRQVDARKKRPGRPGTGLVTLPRDRWHVCLRDQHPAYVSWEQYERNLEVLESNRSKPESAGAIRRGSGLLQGLVFCGRCKKRMRTQSRGESRGTRYVCQQGYVEHGKPLCQSLSARALDEEVRRLTLIALTPAALEVSLQVSENLEHAREELDQQWRRRLERARYEADRAQRQYNAVDPENRLVARTLEKAWENTLREQRNLEEEYERRLRQQSRGLTDEEREAIRRLASDLPALWEAESTTDTDRKDILRQVIDRVVVRVEGETEWVEATVHWAGGQRTYTRFRRAVGRLDQLSNLSDIRDRLADLKGQGLTAGNIASRLNAEGWSTPRRASYNAGMVRKLLSRYGLSQVRRSRPADLHKLDVNEWWLPELARHLGVTDSTLYYWARRGWVRARQLDGRQGRWIATADSEDLEQLRERRARQSRGGNRKTNRTPQVATSSDSA